MDGVQVTVRSIPDEGTMLHVTGVSPRTCVITQRPTSSTFLVSDRETFWTHRPRRKSDP
jgi:hypothetical protein